MPQYQAISTLAPEYSAATDRRPIARCRRSGYLLYDALKARRVNSAAPQAPGEERSMAELRTCFVCGGDIPPTAMALVIENTSAQAVQRRPGQVCQCKTP